MVSLLVAFNSLVRGTVPASVSSFGHYAMASFVATSRPVSHFRLAGICERSTLLRESGEELRKKGHDI
jgi:hypothetical protein